MCRGLHVVRETFVQSSKVVIIRVSSPPPRILRVDLLAHAPYTTGYNVLSAAGFVVEFFNDMQCTEFLVSCL